MKILDASVLIGIFDLINRPDVFDDILKLGHELVIPKYVQKEVDAKALNIDVQKLIKEGKLTYSERNSFVEIMNFKLTTSKLKEGEIDVILTYLKLGGYENSVYCVLDDGDARKSALKLKIKHTGLIGLIIMLEDKGIKSFDEADEILTLLYNSRFHMPKDFKHVRR